MSGTALRGLVALITGAGSGIGAGIARSLSENGAAVVVNDVHAANAQATVEALSQFDTPAHVLIGDVSDASTAARLVAETVDRLGRLDILANNAGVTGGSRVDGTPDDEWHRVFAVNLDAPFFLSRAAVPHMRAQRYGRIINTASVAAIRVSYLGGAAYTASKSGLLGFTRYLAMEVAQYGITVNAILPGLTLTPLVASHTTPEVRERLAHSIPAQRVGHPEDLGSLAAFLSSPESSYITGAAIPVDGGLSVLPGDFTAYRNNSGKNTG